MNGSTLATLRRIWIPAAAVGLVVAAVLRGQPESWLVGALGVALLVRSTAGAVDRGDHHRGAITATYLAIVVIGLVAYLVVA